MSKIEIKNQYKFLVSILNKGRGTKSKDRMIEYGI
jgi:hypothetical protein